MAISSKRQQKIIINDEYYTRESQSSLTWTVKLQSQLSNFNRWKLGDVWYLWECFGELFLRRGSSVIEVLIACSQTIFLFFSQEFSERACERSVRVKAIAEQWQNIPLR